MRNCLICIGVACVCASLAACYRNEDMTLAEIDAAVQAYAGHYLTQTRSKPWQGQPFSAGTVGGDWNTAVQGDIKSFNLWIAERDGSTSAIIGETVDYLADYNTVTKSWEPRAAFFRVAVDEARQRVSVYYTLRDNLYWSFYNSDKKIPVTSDDVVFWYNEIYGDPEFQSSAYPQQFVTLDDGSTAHIDIQRIDDKTFAFHFPVMEADPVLATNMSFGPAFIYKAAKDRGGIAAVQELFKASDDPRTIPSMGRWFITEYVPGQRIVFSRNPGYWELDAGGNAAVYPEHKTAQIVASDSTAYLLFREGKLETYAPKPEELDAVIDGQKGGYSVFNAEGSPAASLWSFNQNPRNKDKAFYRWFCTKEFRQALSCLLNRERIIKQVYRGLGEEKLDFFPEANAFYNPDIVLRYQFSQEHAAELLRSAGFVRGGDGLLYDAQGTAVEFDLSVPSANTMANDIAQIIADECRNAGIKVNVRQVDFQKMVEQLTSTYDWQTLIIGLGSNLFPSQGSNVWPSNGNLHLWYPLQETPATEWEARVDWLYNKAKQIPDKEQAKVLWDEYQSIILEQCPVVYLIRSRSFFAIRDRWNLDNFYFDNKNGAMTDYVYLR